MPTLKLDQQPYLPRRRSQQRLSLFGLGLGVAAIVAFVAVILSNSGQNQTTSSTPTSTTSVTRPSITSITAVQANKLSALQSVQTQVLNTIDEYAQQAWCGPLYQASERPLVMFELDVAQDLREWVPTQSAGLASVLDPMLDQTPLQPTPQTNSLLDLATATAIVPMSVQPAKVTLKTFYCEAAANNPPALLLSDGKSWVGGSILPASKSTVVEGATDKLSIEAAYALIQGTETTYRHLWWSTEIQLSIAGTTPIMTNWAPSGAGGTHPYVLYWATDKYSKKPQYVIRLSNNAWAVSVPSG